MGGRARFRDLWLFDLAADLYAIAAAYYTTFLIRFRSEWGGRFFTRVNQFLGVRDTGVIGESFEDFYLASAFRIVVQLAVVLCLLYALRNLYSGKRFLLRRPVAWDLVVANVMALVVFYAYFYLRRNIFHPRSFFVTVLFCNVFYGVAFRALAARLLRWLRARCGYDRHPAVLLGAGAEAERIAAHLQEARPHGIDLVAKVEAPGAAFEERLAMLLRAIREHGADLVISADKDLSVGQIMRLLEAADQLDVAVKVLSVNLDVLVDRARMAVDRIHGIPLVHFPGPSQSGRFADLRRALSWLLGLALFVISLPLLGVLAALIRLTSKGPALFIQERIGVNRRPFRMLKFRTMYNRAEELQANVEEFNESGTGLFKIRKDPRVTPVGRFLRRFSLDELPQLINVLRGEMTLVGPRPLPRRDFESYYADWHYSRHSGMPGLTCLWQVSGRSDVDFHDMCILDVYYLKNQNWALDLTIILRTFWVVLFAKGAY